MPLHNSKKWSPHCSFKVRFLKINCWTVREDSIHDSVIAFLIQTTVVANCVIKTKIRESKQYYSNKPQTFIQLCGLRDSSLFQAVNSPCQMIHLFNQFIKRWRKNADLQKHLQADAHNNDNIRFQKLNADNWIITDRTNLCCWLV